MILTKFNIYYTVFTIFLHSNQDSIILMKKTDDLTNGVEQRTQTQTHTNEVNWSLTKKQRQFKGERIVFSVNGAGIVLLYGEKKNLDMQLILFTKTNSSETKCKTWNYITSRIQQEQTKMTLGLVMNF